MNCSICKEEIKSVNGWDGGCNAEPVNDGRCCQDCDNFVVIPTRIALWSKREEGEK